MIATRDEAEAAILGAILLSDTLASVAVEEGVRPEHFRLEQDRHIYRAMLALADDGQPIDTLTLKARLEGTNVTVADVERHHAGAPNIANIRGYCQIVRHEARLQHAQAVIGEAASAIANRDLDSALAAAARIDTDAPATARRDQAQEFIAWYEAEHKGIPLPFGELTEYVGGGLRPGETTVVGAWTGHGKSLWTMAMLLCAQRAGYRAHDYANEMSGVARTTRLIASLTGIPTRKIRHKQLSSDDWGKVLRVLGELPYESTATEGWSVDDYCRDLRRHRWDVACIDTVTNLGCRDVPEWDEAAIRLADVAAQTGTHLIEVCQLNNTRAREQILPPPTMRDLRNTGVWAHRARQVMFVYREQEMVELGSGGAEVRRELPEGHIRADKASHHDGSGIEAVPVWLNSRWLRFDAIDGASGAVVRMGEAA